MSYLSKQKDISPKKSQKLKDYEFLIRKTI
ncbi:MAG: hypothetical protein GBAus27B_000364 [Mycoplasmataceae bacterium]|nr:MAG: hypothetical protein GBAus27B_000364 [Mycoplasmataceae bacterium]